MKRFLTAFITLFFLLGTPCSWASISNGNFETGDLSNWVVSGPGDVYVTEQNGDHFAVLKTGYDPTTGEYVTILSQDFVVPSNPLPLSFDFYFETTDPDSAAWSIDALTVSLESAARNLYDFLIVDYTGVYTDPSVTLTPSTIFNSGYHLDIDISACAGVSGTLYFELWDEDDLADSTVYIDNVNSAAVPIPGTLLLFASGLMGLSSLRRQL